MNELDSLYVQLLRIGLPALRNAAQNGDLEHCQVEAEHLHEIPSLIGEANLRCHLLYMNKTRGRYLEWASNCHRASVDELVDFWYSSIWSQISELLSMEDGNIN